MDSITKNGNTTTMTIGYFGAADCATLKRIMNGKTFYKWRVEYSSEAGNCTLIVSTDYKASAKSIQAAFTHYALSQLAEACEHRTAHRYEVVEFTNGLHIRTATAFSELNLAVDMYATLVARGSVASLVEVDDDNDRREVLNTNA